MNKILMVAALAASVSASTVQAGVHIGIALPGLDFQTDPCTVETVNGPEYCQYPVYNEPVFVNGVWVTRPLHYRIIEGQRQFFVNKAWRSEGVARDRGFDHRR